MWIWLMRNRLTYSRTEEVVLIEFLNFNGFKNFEKFNLKVVKNAETSEFAKNQFS